MTFSKVLNSGNSRFYKGFKDLTFKKGMPFCVKVLNFNKLELTTLQTKNY